MAFGVKDTHENLHKCKSTCIKETPLAREIQINLAREKFINWDGSFNWLYYATINNNNFIQKHMKVTLEFETENIKSVIDVYRIIFPLLPKTEQKNEGELPIYLTRQATEAQIWTIKNAKSTERPPALRQYTDKQIEVLTFEEAIEAVSHIKKVQADTKLVVSPSASPSQSEIEEADVPITPEAKARIMSKMCSIRGCFKKVFAKGLCQKHYMDAYKRSKISG